MSGVSNQNPHSFNAGDKRTLKNYASPSFFGKKVTHEEASKALTKWENLCNSDDLEIKDIFLTFINLRNSALYKSTDLNNHAEKISNKLKNDEMTPEDIETGLLFLEYCTCKKDLENLFSIKLRYLEMNPNFDITNLFNKKDIQMLSSKQIAKLFELAKNGAAKTFIRDSLTDEAFKSLILDHVKYLLQSNYGGSKVIHFMQDANIEVETLCDALEKLNPRHIRSSRLETLREHLLNANNKPELIKHLKKKIKTSPFLQILISGTDKTFNREEKVNFMGEEAPPNLIEFIKKVASLNKIEVTGDAKNYLTELLKTVSDVEEEQFSIKEEVLSKIYDLCYEYRDQLPEEAKKDQRIVTNILNRATKKFENDNNLKKTLPWYNTAIDLRLDVNKYLRAQIPYLQKDKQVPINYNNTEDFNTERTEQFQSFVEKSMKKQLSLINGGVNIDVSSFFSDQEIKKLTIHNLKALISIYIEQNSSSLNFLGKTAAGNILYLYQNIDQTLKSAFIRELADVAYNMNKKNENNDKTPLYQIDNLQKALQQICVLDNKSYQDFLLEYLPSNKTMAIEDRRKIYKILTKNIELTTDFINNNALRSWLGGK